MGRHSRVTGRHRAPSTTGRTAVRVITAGVAVSPLALTGTASAAERMPDDVRAAIISCESGGDATAQNPHSTASGAYQFVNGTWRLFGGSTARARDASLDEQHRVADRAFAKNGLRDWEASRACWGPKLGRHASGKESARHAVSTPPRHGDPDGGDLYVVRRGDTLARIAAAHHVALNTIITNNRDVVDDPDLIYPGERLRV